MQQRFLTVMLLFAAMTPAFAADRVYKTKLGEFRVSQVASQTAKGQLVRHKIRTPKGKDIYSSLPILDIADYGNGEVWVAKNYYIAKYNPDEDAASDPEKKRYAYIFREIYRAPRRHALSMPFKWGERKYYVVYLMSQHIRGKSDRVFRGFLGAYSYKTRNTIQYLPYTELPTTEPWMVKRVKGDKEKLTIFLERPDTGAKQELPFPKSQEFPSKKDLI